MANPQLSTVMFQFHARGDELIALAERWAGEHGFAIAVEQFWPEYRAVAISIDPRVAPDRLESFDRIAIGPDPFDLTSKRPHEFVASNPNHLFLKFYMPKPRGLPESWISGATGDPEQLRLWHRLIRVERAAMHHGARVQSFDKANSVGRPSHRHTIGAHELAAQGVRMLAAGGGNEVVFDDLGAVDASARSIPAE